jgi:7,8-dihydroneopterin 2',3'-cyclic phosphate phosphodiesterase
MVEKLIKLAQNIKDDSLRNKVINYLKDPSLSHKEFKKYPQGKIEEVKTPFTIGHIGTSERDVLNHTISVTEVCIKIADLIENIYGVKINRDYLIAGALIHDVMKIFEWKKENDSIEHTGILLDHSMLGVAELYRREFPEQVIHIVASHFGEAGPTPPRTIEALILHYVDNMLSIIESYVVGIKPIQQPTQFIVLDEETFKKLQGKE